MYFRTYKFDKNTQKNTRDEEHIALQKCTRETLLLRARCTSARETLHDDSTKAGGQVPFINVELNVLSHNSSNRPIAFAIMNTIMNRALGGN